MEFKVYLRSDLAQVPKRADNGAAGYDLYSAENTIVNQGTRKLVSTDISIQLPNETYGRIAPRSGLSVKGIDVGAGVVDQSYTGVVKVLLINNSSNDFEVKRGDRIAQLIIEKCFYPEITVVDSLDKFTTSTRGEGGFGSTGLK
jgi:dUTP pyrophosphatase